MRRTVVAIHTFEWIEDDNEDSDATELCTGQFTKWQINYYHHMTCKVLQISLIFPTWIIHD